MEEQENDQDDGVAVLDEPVASEADLAAMVPERFAVRDRAAAEWLVRKLVESDAHIARVKEQAVREVRRTERERDFLRLRFGGELEAWTRTELAQRKGRSKSVLLLAGTVGFRACAPKLAIQQDDRLLAWAKRYCKAAVVVVERVSKTALNQHFKTTGDLPAGTRLEPARETFYVK